MAITTLMATFVALHWKLQRLARLTGERQPAGSRSAVFCLDLDEAARRRLVSAADRLSSSPSSCSPGARARRSWTPCALEVRRNTKGIHRRPQERSAPSHSRDRGRARPHGQGRTARAHAQPQVQPRTARKCAAGRGRDRPRRRASRTRSASRSRRSPKGITRVELRFGFMEQPNVPAGLTVAIAREQIANCDLVASDLLHRSRDHHSVRTSRGHGRDGARRCSRLMHHNAQRPGAYFKIPSKQIMEIGVEFEI